MNCLWIFEVDWKKKKEIRLNLILRTGRQIDRGPAQWLGCAGRGGDVEGGFAGVRLRAGEANPAEPVST